ALIEEAGATGAAVQIIQGSGEPYRSMAEVLQQQLNDVGLNVELVSMGNSEVRVWWREGGYHGVVLSLLGQPESSITLNRGYTGPDTPSPVPEELTAMADAALALP